MVSVHACVSHQVTGTEPILSHPNELIDLIVHISPTNLLLPKNERKLTPPPFKFCAFQKANIWSTGISPLVVIRLPGLDWSNFRRMYIHLNLAHRKTGPTQKQRILVQKWPLYHFAPSVGCLKSWSTYNLHSCSRPKKKKEALFRL